MCRDGRGLGSKLVSFTKGFSKHPHILAIFKVDSEYCLRFPFKVKADYFILYSVLVYSCVIFLTFFAMNKRRRTNEASLLNYSKLVSFANEFSKHPHILAIFKVDSEYLRFPFKLKVDYFILYSILVYGFVIFLIFFAMNKRRCTFEAEQFFHSNVYMFKRKQKWTTAYQHVISRASHISVSVKWTFWYLSLFFLEWSTINFCYSSRFVSLARFHYKNCKNKKKNSLRFLFFLPLSSYCNQIY